MAQDFLTSTSCSQHLCLLVRRIRHPFFQVLRIFAPGKLFVESLSLNLEAYSLRVPPNHDHVPYIIPTYIAPNLNGFIPKYQVLRTLT